jgi:hypothetical protein
MKATKLVTFAAIISMAIAISIKAQTSNKQSATNNPVKAMAWVVGGTWIADTSNLGPGMQRIETRYDWSDNGSYIRFTTHFVSDKGTLKNYDGSFFYDPTGKTLSMWYMDAGGSITQGPMTIEGDHWQMAFRGPDFAGKIADLQVDVLRKSNDLYHWSVSEKDGDTWKKLLELDYARKA